MKQVLRSVRSLPRALIAKLRRSKAGAGGAEESERAQAPAEVAPTPLINNDPRALRDMDADEEAAELAAEQAEQKRLRRADRLRKLKKWGLRGAGIVLVGGVAIQTAMWALVTSAAKKDVAQWIERENAAGRQIEVASIAYSGFPLHVEARLKDYRLVLFGGRVIWTGEMAVGRGSVWNPSELAVSLPSEQHIQVIIDGKTGAFSFHPEESEIAIDTSGSAGPIAKGDMRDVTIKFGEEMLKTKLVKLSAAPRKARTARETRLAVSVTMVNGLFGRLHKSPFGRKLQSARFEAKLKGPFGTGPLDREFERWRRVQGQLEIERASLNWGPLRVNVNGSVGLDQNRRALGSFRAKVAGFKETLQLLVDSRTIAPKTATWFKVAMSSTAVRRGLGDRAHLAAEMGVTLQNNRLKAGAVPLVTLPDLTFR